MSSKDVDYIVDSSVKKCFDDIIVLGVLNGNVHLSSSMTLDTELHGMIVQLAKAIGIRRMAIPQIKPFSTPPTNCIPSLSVMDIDRLADADENFRVGKRNPEMTLTEWAARGK